MNIFVKLLALLHDCPINLQDRMIHRIWTAYEQCRDSGKLTGNDIEDFLIILHQVKYNRIGVDFVFDRLRNRIEFAVLKCSIKGIPK